MPKIQKYITDETNQKLVSLLQMYGITFEQFLSISLKQIELTRCPVCQSAMIDGICVNNKQPTRKQRSRAKKAGVHKSYQAMITYKGDRWLEFFEEHGEKIFHWSDGQFAPYLAIKKIEAEMRLGLAAYLYEKDKETYVKFGSGIVLPVADVGYNREDGFFSKSENLDRDTEF